MKPRLNRHLPPNFHELDWRKFQGLCNELFAHEPEIGTSDEYGIPGQGQLGIDLLATVKPTGVEVAQCKCEASFSVAKIRKASNKFFEHWTHWKEKGVRRFILFVAGDVNRTQLLEERDRQRERFAQRSMEYELWGATTIGIKLRPYRGIAQRYIDSEEIVNAICPSAVDSPAMQVGAAVMMERLGVQAIELEDLRGKELENLRDLCRIGEQSKALAGVAVIKSAQSWPSHTPAFRARVLRFEAALHLNLHRDLATATKRLDEARQTDASGDFQTIDAYLAYCQRALPAALAFLAEPKTVEARNLRWSLLLETGEYDTLTKETISSAFPPDADTHRVLALFALARGDLQVAQSAATKALEMSATRRSVRLAKAVVDYFSALSPVAEAMKRLGCAVPVSWAFVKRDSASINALRAAAATFVDCARHPDCLPTERENLQAWHLACVACVDYLQVESAKLAQDLLAENPANSSVVAWAINRGYSFDAAKVEAALQARLLNEPDNIDVWLALWSTVWQSDDLARSEAVIDNAEDAFRRTGNVDVWLFHKVQFVCRRNGTEAKGLVERIANAELRASAGIAIARSGSRAVKAKKAFAEQLAQEFTATGDVRRLFECCELKLRLRDYGFIVENARALVEGIGTASALLLALEAACKHGDHALCLSLLQDYRHVFRDGALSPGVRLLKAACQHQLGNWPEATKEAEQGYREQSSVSTFLAFFNLLLLSGETRRCSVLARDLLTMKGAKPLHLLRVAAVTRMHDLDLAKELWRLANRTKIKNLNLAAGAFNLAVELGLTSEAKPLFLRLQRLAQQGKGPMREKTLLEMTELFEAQHESNEKNTRLYERGDVPAHFLYEQQRRPMVLAYHAQLETNRAQTNLLQTPALYARSGARRVNPDVPPNNLLVDISSLLLATDLGILDLIETNFGPLYISPHATTSLLEQATQLQPAQPERQEARQIFVKLVQSRRIAAVEFVSTVTIVGEDVRRQLGEEHVSLLEIAVKENGLVLQDGPFFSLDGTPVAVELPPGINSRIIPPDFLQGSQPTSQKILRPITDGTVILVPHNVVASLPSEKIESFAQRFRVMTTIMAVRELEREVAAFDFRIRLTNWTQALLDHIQRGIAVGTYCIMRPSPPPEKLDRTTNSTTKAMFDLLLATGLPGGATWCDDRSINRHARAVDRPIVGISEMINGLLKKGSLSKGDFFDIILRLRQSNVRYIPIADGEILHHLERAEIKNGRVVETAALATIRRYINACLLDRGKLQSHVVDQHGNIDVRESEFPLGLRRAVDEAVRDVWKNTEADISARAARADWILESIFFDLLGVRQSLGERTNTGDVRGMTATSIGLLYGDGIGLDFRSAGNGQAPPGSAYFHWLNERLLAPLKRIEPVAVSLVAKSVAQFIISAANDPSLAKTPQERSVGRALWGLFIQHLPQELQTELDLPPDVQAYVGMTVYGTCVKIGDRIYNDQGYWQAMAEAVNGRVGRVSEYKESHELVVSFARRDANGKVWVRFASDDPGECGIYAEKAFPVLCDSIDDRIKFMETRLHWFDCPAMKRAGLIQRIARIESASDRAKALTEQLEGSSEVAYQQLGARLAQPGNFGLSDLYLPSWERLLDHLRLSPLGAAGADLTSAAKTLLTEEGLVVALRRLMCLPVRLPPVLEAAWQSLSSEDAGTLYNQLCGEEYSLLTNLHLLRLAALRDSPELWKKAEEILDRLLDPATGRQYFKFFRSVLWLIDREFTRWPAGRSLPASIRLACIWYHAARLDGYLSRMDNDLPRLTDWLDKNSDNWTQDVLARDEGFAHDIARAANVTHGFLVLHGMAYLLGDLPACALHLATAAKFRSVLLADIGSTRLELLRRSNLSGNALGSFLGQASASSIQLVFGEESTKLFSFPTDEEIASSLESLAKAPHEAKNWIVMHSVIGDGMMPATLRPRLYEILQTVDFTGLARSNVRLLGIALTFVCRQVQASGDKALIQRMERIIMGFAKLATAPPEGTEAELPLWLLLPEALLELVVIPGNEDESARRFFDAFRRFAELCPPLANQTASTAMQWTNRLPFEQQVNLWPFIFTLRALR